MIRKFLSEPLLHFGVIGIALFALFFFVSDETPTQDEGVIFISRHDVAQLSGGFEAVWRRPPSADELDGLIEDHIREEVFVREALELGLDSNDAVIRQRLRQKMEFIVSAAANALEPDDAELQAHLTAEADRFTTSGGVAFAQVYLGGAPSEADVTAVQNALLAGQDPSSLGERSLLPTQVPMSADVQIDSSFGRGFCDAIAQLEPKTWSGPVRSGFGAHLIFVEEIRPPTLPDLASIKADVTSDWRRQKAEELRERQFETLLARYDVQREDVTE